MRGLITSPFNGKYEKLLDAPAIQIHSAKLKGKVKGESPAFSVV
jgi:hypothetical protein